MNMELIVLLGGLLLAHAGTDHRKLLDKLAEAGAERAQHQVTYDPSYRVVPYPSGDVPPDKGVCTDVVIRSYRALGIDLQKEVHEDMAAHFAEYPRAFGLSQPDSNIDHRRVPNLEAFFRRKGESLKVTRAPADYTPGDIVSWTLPSGLRHIGLLTGKKAPSGNYLVIHNIGRGDVLEDVLFEWEITGHFRYYGPVP
jgi:uncharacterized protein YijF (DUF1287 family)